MLYKSLLSLQDLCFKYMWNNFLHTQVEQSVSTVLAGNAADEGSNEEEKSDNHLLDHVRIFVNHLLTIYSPPFNFSPDG